MDASEDDAAPREDLEELELRLLRLDTDGERELLLDLPLLRLSKEAEDDRPLLLDPLLVRLLALLTRVGGGDAGLRSRSRLSLLGTGR